MKLLVFIVMNIIAILLIFFGKSKHKMHIWYAGYLSMFSLGLFVATIDPIPNTVIADKIIFKELIARLISAISFRFSPWFFACAFISASDFFKNKKFWYYILSLPIFASFIYDFLNIKDSFIYIYLDYSKQFKIMFIWVFIYAIISNFLCILEFIKENNLKQKLRKLAIMLLTLPSFFILYQVYWMPMKLQSNHDFTPYTIGFGLFITVLFLYLANKIGLFGLKIKLYSIDEFNEILETYKLSNMEKNVFIDTLNNLTVKQISEKQNLAQQTVKNYRREIFVKLNVKNSDELKNNFEKFIQK